jgi:hypothetical protein
MLEYCTCEISMVTLLLEWRWILALHNPMEPRNPKLLYAKCTLSVLVSFLYTDCVFACFFIYFFCLLLPFVSLFYLQCTDMYFVSVPKFQLISVLSSIQIYSVLCLLNCFILLIRFSILTFYLILRLHFYSLLPIFCASDFRCVCFSFDSLLLCLYNIPPVPSYLSLLSFLDSFHYRNNI